MGFFFFIRRFIFFPNVSRQRKSFPIVSENEEKKSKWTFIISWRHYYCDRELVRNNDIVFPRVIMTRRQIFSLNVNGQLDLAIVNEVTLVRTYLRAAFIPYANGLSFSRSRLQTSWERDPSREKMSVTDAVCGSRNFTAGNCFETVSILQKNISFLNVSVFLFFFFFTFFLWFWGCDVFFFYCELRIFSPRQTNNELNNWDC